MLYFVRGYMPIMYAHLRPRSFRLVSAFGYGLGSLFMMAAGALMIARLSDEEAQPEPLPHQKARVSHALVMPLSARAARRSCMRSCCHQKARPSCP
jgi:hypothetical protein